MKRTIKPAAGISRISPQDAAAAARVVRRDKNTGRLIVLEPDGPSAAGKSRDRSRTLKERRVSGSPNRSSQQESKNR